MFILLQRKFRWLSADALHMHMHMNNEPEHTIWLTHF